MSRRRRRIGGGASAPGIIAGAAMHISAFDLPTNSTTIQTWPDRTSNGNSPTNATANQRPTYGATSCNGRPGVTGDGSNDSLATGSIIPTNSNYTITAVCSANDIANDSVLCSFGGLLQLQSLTARGAIMRHSFALTQAQTPMVQSQAYIVTAVYRGATGASDLYINGMICGTYSTFAANFTAAAFTLFSGGGVWDKITIGEMIVYPSALSPAQISINHNSLSRIWGIPVEAYKQYINKFKLIITAGQSNDVGLGGVTSNTLDVAVDRIYQLGREAPHNMEIMTAFDPMQHYNVNTTTAGVGVGFNLTNAKKLLATINSDEALVILPCGFGNTGFSGNNWNPGNTLYEDMISRIIAFLQLYPNSQIIIWDWHQGEFDDLQTQSYYTTHIQAMVADARSRISALASVPFIVGGTLIGGNQTVASISSALANVPATITNASYTTPVNLVSGGDNLHYSAASYRTFGARYAYNLPPPGTPFARLDCSQSLVDTVSSIGMSSAFVALTPTVTGTSGGNTLLCNGDVHTQIDSSGVQVIRAGASDKYTVSSVATSVGISTITIVGTLSTNYTAAALAILRISQLNDLMGNSNDLTESTAARRPIYIPQAANALPALKFNSAETTKLVGSTAAANKLTRTTTHTFIMVFKAGLTSASPGQVLINAAKGGAGNDLMVASIKSNVLSVGYWDGTSFVSQSVAFTDTTGYHILSVSHAANSTPICYLDNLQMTGTTNPQVGTSDGLTIGGDNSGDTYDLDGYVAEFEPWDSQLTAATILKYTQQLAGKWNITIS